MIAPSQTRAADAPRRESGPARYGWLIAALVLLGLTLFLLRNWLKGGLPTSARQEVLTEMTITWMFRQELLQGHLLSEWNPTWFSGFPWLRYLSYPVYYLTAALSAWGGIALEKVLVIYYLGVLYASGLMMFGYLRRLTGDWRAALVGAVAYEAIPVHNHVGVETWIHAAIWALVPLVLWLIELSRAGGKRRIHYLLLTGMALGCFPFISSEYTIIAAPFLALYLLWREMGDVWRGKRTWRGMMAGIGLIALVAFGIAAFFILPGIPETRYVGIHSKQGGGTLFSDDLLRQYAVTPGVIWFAILRRFKLAANDQGLPWVVRTFWSVAWYPGLIVPLLALLGLTGLRHHEPARISLVNLALAALFATGPTYSINLFSKLPVIGRLMPFRGVLLAVVFLCVLVAFGASWLLRRFHARWLVWGLCGGLILLMVADFIPSAMAYQTTKAYYTPDERQAYAWLAQRQGQGRLWEVASQPRDQYLRSYSLAEAPMLRHAGYYDNGAPLYTWQQIAWTDLRTQLHLHQVRFVLLRQGDADAVKLSDQLTDAGCRIAFQAGPVQIWENPTAGGYAEVYGQAALDVTQDFHFPFKALPDLVWRNIAMVTPPTFYLDEIDSGDLKHYNYFLVDQPATRNTGALPAMLKTVEHQLITADKASELKTAPPVAAAVWTERVNYDEIYLKVYTPQAGVLSLAESWYPHWRVQVDGRFEPVLRVNWALLGVWVEPGEHDILFRFQRPWYAYLGYALSAFTLLTLIIWWTWLSSQVFKRPNAISWEDTKA